MINFLSIFPAGLSNECQITVNNVDYEFNINCEQFVKLMTVVRFDIEHDLTFTTLYNNRGIDGKQAKKVLTILAEQFKLKTINDYENN